MRVPHTDTDDARAHLHGDDCAEALPQKIAREVCRLSSGGNTIAVGRVRIQWWLVAVEVGAAAIQGVKAASVRTFSLSLPAERACALSTRVTAALRPST